MENRRDAVLDGTLEAARLHRTLQIESKIALFGGRVDVFAIIIDQGANLVFRKLKGLLGAYLPAPSPGILVTTERPLAIQRFTAAHEFGHFCMKHKGSLDDEAMLQRSPFLSPGYNVNEVAADAFASEFLLPEWLVNYQAERQKWRLGDLEDPRIVYQLSLRVGVSYEATCRMLGRHGLLTRPSVASLSAVGLKKKIKQQLLWPHSVSNWSPNVWLLTERDEGSVIYGEPDDMFVVRVNEHTGSGYLWNLEQVAAAGFTVVSDERQPTGSPGEIGGGVQRTLTAQSPEALLGNVDLVETRPWDRSDSFGHLSFAFDFRGKEHGLPRAARERLFAA